MNYGVIVVGYQGIGKSTVANRNMGFVDLESGSFWVGNKRSHDWYIPYCNIAINLAEQGYVVFTSSHQVVRDYLNSLPLPDNVKLACCVPSLQLKDLWINKLWDRWKLSGLDKDFKAYANASERYEENINEIKSSFKVVCEITGLNYELEKLLDSTFKIHGIDSGIYELGNKKS